MRPFLSPRSLARSDIARAMLAIVALFIPAASRAQSAASLGLAAGATIPLNTYGADKNVGYHLGLVLDVRLPTDALGVRVDGTFNEMKYSGNSTKAQIWCASGNLLLKMPISSVVAPYLIAGAGVYNSRRTLLFGSTGSTDFGFNAGGGLRYKLTDGFAFVEARYHAVSGGNDIRILPISIGIIF